MKIERERTLAAAPDRVWEVVGDPARLRDWWPRVERVESVDTAGFTEVYRTAKGKQVRADFRIGTLDEPREIRVVQQLDGTPFARVFSEASKRVVLTPTADGGTKVKVELDQTPAKMARFGGHMVRKAMRRQLDDGLDALAALLSPA